MKQLFLHIGYSKSGSTSIQEFLSSNQIELMNRGFYYPQQTNLGRVDSYDIYSRAIKGSEADLKELLASYFEKKDKVILSSEFIPSFVDIFARATNFIDEVKIIAYVRRQDDWLESAYQQLVKCKDGDGTGETVRGIVDSPAEFAQKYTNKSIDWYDNLERWAKHFGTESIIVKPFHKDFFTKARLEFDFLSSLGFEDFTNLNITNKSMNTSIPNQLVEMLIKHNRILPESSFPAGWVLCKEILKDIELGAFPQGSFLSDLERESFLNNYKESNRLLVQKYFNNDERVLNYFERSLSREVNLSYSEYENDSTAILMQMIYRQSHKIKKLADKLDVLESELDAVKNR